MYKNKENNIEGVITKIILNDTLHYLIKYRGIKLPQLLEENKLTQNEKNICEKSLLNQKRKKSDSDKSDIGISKSSINNKQKIDKNNKKKNIMNDSYYSFSFSNPKTKYTKNKKEKIVKEYCGQEKSYKNKKNNIMKEKIKDNEKKSDKNRETITKNEAKNKTVSERDGVLFKDTPMKIINVGYRNKENKTLYSLVRWKQSGSARILDSIVENTKIRKECPDLLIDYYESKIIFLED